MTATPPQVFPRIGALGLDGILVQFAARLSEPANRAALAFRAAVDAAAFPGVAEISSSLAGTYLRFDPDAADPASLTDGLRALLDSRDWYRAPLPHNRRLWRIPTVLGGDHGPQLELAASLAGISTAEAVAEIAACRLRVMAIGFAPGQPYLGELPDRWNLPRQSDLKTRVPPGAVALAVRQCVLFPAESATGWYHIGQTAFRCFRPTGDPAFPLSPGDEIVFDPVAPKDLEALASAPAGGATAEPLA
ncbi:allophanate hydrolase subunit 1 [Tropicimonas sp. IMCC34043]|uniref:5-oxoprolinase subunit B family protein n=1 Tax=Tropicimonas sp. IMCC34043 TaxID=2248760 RepID=UPI000E266654|nr:carboxyltransferase domain-containing protein [Tropicimonas sp. IMCC34043]